MSRPGAGGAGSSTRGLTAGVVAGLGITAGMVAAFNPCGFALLPA